MCKKTKSESRKAFSGKRYRMTLITLSKHFMLNSFFLKIFNIRVWPIKPFLKGRYFKFKLKQIFTAEMYQVLKIW